MLGYRRSPWVLLLSGTFVLLGVGGAKSFLSLFVPSITSRSVSQSAQESGWIAGAAERQRINDWFLSQFHLLGQTGMEPGSAGFHLLRPGVDHLWDSMYTVWQSGGWAWWPVETRHFIPYSRGELPEAAAAVSFRRPFRGAAADYSVVQSTTGLFQVEAAFDMNVLGAVHGPTSGAGAYTDWFQVVHPSGGPATRMQAVVVADNKADYPFSITDLLTGLAENPVVIAKDLDLVSANALVYKLEH